MKKIALLALLLSGCATPPDCTEYATVGAGYKFHEKELYFQDGSTNHPISARMELGRECGPWSFGLSHHSQWFAGWPVNGKREYGKSEVFIDYTVKFKVGE